MKWFARQRQEFITGHIAKHGWIGRAPICDYFEISEPSASADISAWRENNPDALTYNFKAKRWEALGR